MSKFKLQYLELEGFRSFKERQRIEFPEKGMVLISGIYKGSSISSGSGKSSILEAIAFALDICEIPAVQLKNWDSKSIYVKLGIKRGDQLIEIERTPKMNLILNGESYSDLATGAVEKLYQILGLTPEILATVSYRRQRAKGKFLNFTDSEIKKFLSKTLNLEELEQAYTDFTKKANDLDPKIAASQSEINAFMSMVESVKVLPEEISAAESRIKAAEADLAQIGDVNLKKGQIFTKIETITNLITDLETEKVTVSLQSEGVLNDSFNLEVNAKTFELQTKIEILELGLKNYNPAEDQDVKTLLSEISALEIEYNQNFNDATQIDSLVLSCERKKTENFNIKNVILALKEKAAKLTEHSCPTCNRDWVESKDLLDKTELEIQGHLSLMQENMTYLKNATASIERLPSVKARANELNGIISTKKSEIKTKKEAFQAKVQVERMSLSGQIAVINGDRNIKNGMKQAEFIGKIKDIDNTIANKRTEIMNLKSEAFNLDRPAELAKSALNMAQSALVQINKKIEQQEALNAKIDGAKANFIQLETEKAIYTEAAKAVGRNGFLGFIFDEVLVSIQNRINTMLAKIPNVDTFRVDISSTKTNKTNKTLKKEISINISKNGNDIILDALSGGQQTGVELIADISVAQEIKLKAGSAIDWMILDEAMDGFGTAEKEAALNMLKENFDGLILIVDHTTEIKEAFEKIIEVEYDGKNSNVTAS